MARSPRRAPLNTAQSAWYSRWEIGSSLWSWQRAQLMVTPHVAAITCVIMSSCVLASTLPLFASQMFPVSFWRATVTTLDSPYVSALRGGELSDPEVRAAMRSRLLALAERMVVPRV